MTHLDPRIARSWIQQFAALLDDDDGPARCWHCGDWTIYRRFMRVLPNGKTAPICKRCHQAMLRRTGAL